MDNRISTKQQARTQTLIQEEGVHGCMTDLGPKDWE